jgi:hypothetical protein
MTETADELALLQAAWLDRFGEPPPIVAEPAMMRRIMSRVIDRFDEENPRAGQPGGLEEGLQS